MSSSTDENEKSNVPRGHPWLRIEDEGAERREIAETLKTVLDVLLRIEGLLRRNEGRSTR